MGALKEQSDSSLQKGLGCLSAERARAFLSGCKVSRESVLYETTGDTGTVQKKTGWETEERKQRQRLPTQRPRANPPFFHLVFSHWEPPWDLVLCVGWEHRAVPRVIRGCCPEAGGTQKVHALEGVYRRDSS